MSVGCSLELDRPRAVCFVHVLKHKEIHSANSLFREVLDTTTKKSYYVSRDKNLQRGKGDL